MEYPDIAEDLALQSYDHIQKQEKTAVLKTPIQIGLRINNNKTELMKINTSFRVQVTVGGEPIREVDSFVYLGSAVDRQGGTDFDVKVRIGKAQVAFVMPRNT